VRRGPKLIGGDHVCVKRPSGIYHHGIFLGGGQVIHFSGGETGSKTDAEIRIDSLETFGGSWLVEVRSYANPPDPELVIERAQSRLGERGYHLVFNNCEHFARWCVTGEHLSEQVTVVATSTAVIGTPVLATAVGCDLIASAGLVKGVSGPGVMSALKAVGGSAVSGLVLAGAVPAAVTVGVAWWAFRDDQHLPSPERDARGVARVASIVGAGITSASGIAAVSALGYGGLSAAGISSGLAAIGGFFGGGMVAGALALIAAPPIGAAILAAGAYFLFRWWSTRQGAGGGSSDLDVALL